MVEPPSHRDFEQAYAIAASVRSHANNEAYELRSRLESERLDQLQELRRLANHSLNEMRRAMRTTPQSPWSVFQASTVYSVVSCVAVRSIGQSRGLLTLIVFVDALPRRWPGR